MSMNQFRPLFLFAATLLASCASAPNQAPGTDKQHVAITEEERSAACADGFAPSANDGRVCNVVHDDKCFETAAEACTCAGCGEAECIVLESYPAQARCVTAPGEPDPDLDQGNASDGASSTPAEPAAPSDGSSIPPAPPSSPGGGSPPSVPPSQPGQPPVACSGGVPAANAASNTACNLIHAGQCFGSVEDACACAGCGVEDCRVLESYPAQVACD
ncbi:MAG TPA: hypothetical protein VIM73_10540 [Polyangiaceae bacterium]